jgi:hypothetical protein
MRWIASGKNSITQVESNQGGIVGRKATLSHKNLPALRGVARAALLWACFISARNIFHPFAVEIDTKRVAAYLAKSSK